MFFSVRAGHGPRTDNNIFTPKENRERSVAILQRNFSILSVIVMISLLALGCLGAGTGQYTVAGTIRDQGGSGVAGVVIRFKGAKIDNRVRTEADGSWRSGPLSGTVIVAPEGDLIFEPPSRQVRGAEKNVDFVVLTEKPAYLEGFLTLVHSFSTPGRDEPSFAARWPDKNGDWAVKTAEAHLQEQVIIFDSALEPFEQKRMLMAAGFELVDTIEILNAHLVQTEGRKRAADFSRLQGIISIDYDAPRSVTGNVVPNDPDYPLQWQYPLIRLPQAWSAVTGDPTVRVAIIDSGIDLQHPDLVANLDLNSAAGFVKGEPGADDLHGHGTHVAGIIGAVANNSRGVAGVMWEVELIPLKVLGADGRGSAWAVSKAILYAAGLAPDPEGRDNEKPAHIINLSLGGPASPLEEQAIGLAQEAGVIMVAATGNDGIASLAYPAAYPQVIAVGAVGGGGTPHLAPYSNYGPGIDVVAPGGDGVRQDYSDWILSTYPGGYGHLAGTSMACAHVTGVIGLMLANGIAKNEIEDILQRTAMQIGDSHYFGHGLINAAWAVNGVDRMRIILGSREDYRINAVKDISLSPQGGDFSMRLLPGRQQLMAWVDVNGNGFVDRGDYYCETSPLEISGGQQWSWRAALEEVKDLEMIQPIEPVRVID